MLVAMLLQMVLQESKEFMCKIPLVLACTALVWGQTTAALAGPPRRDTRPVPKKEGRTVTTRSGLQYVDLKVGAGPSPRPGQEVTVQYTGTLKSNGKKFESSIDRGMPFIFTVGQGQVVKGWDEGMLTMKVGGRRRLIVPPDLGYGTRGGGVIPPNSTLVLDVELLGIR